MGFLADLFGDSQREDMERAKAASDASLKKGYDEASNTFQNYGQQALNYFTPYVNDGRRANVLYQDSLGVNGAQGGQNALAAYQSARNPYLDYQMDQTQRGMDARANARGSLNSGANALAVARARQGMGYQDYADWQNKLNSAGQQGYNAASTAGQMTQQQGQYLSDMRYGYGQQQAGQETNFGNAMAASRSIGINNLINIAGTAAKAASAYGGK